MESFAVVCATSFPSEQRHLITAAFALVRDRDPRLVATVARLDAKPDGWEAADLLVCLGDDPWAAEAIHHAQAVGVPVVAVEGGAVAELVQSGRSGFIVPASPAPLADAISWLAHRPPVRERLRAGGLLAAGARLAQPA